MREILFRGKRTFNGEWVEGYYVHLTNESINKHRIYTDYVETDFGELTTHYEVAPDTVGQYTGLTDKNGVRIFEGDVVSYNNSLHEVVFVHKYGNAYFGIVFEDRLEIWPFSPSVPASIMLVIGNIHDNPELLGGGGDE